MKSLKTLPFPVHKLIIILIIICSGMCILWWYVCPRVCSLFVELEIQFILLEPLCHCFYVAYILLVSFLAVGVTHSYQLLSGILKILFHIYSLIYFHQSYLFCTVLFLPFACHVCHLCSFSCQCLHYLI